MSQSMRLGQHHMFGAQTVFGENLKILICGILRQQNLSSRQNQASVLRMLFYFQDWTVA